VRLDDAWRWRHVRLRRRGCAGEQAAGRRGGRPDRVPDVARDGRADRIGRGRLDARGRLEPDAPRTDDEPAPRSGGRNARGLARRRRRRDLHGDEQELVDRRQAAQLPVRDADRVGDQRRQAREDAARRHLHRNHAGLLGQARGGGRAGRMADAGDYQLRQMPAGTGGARVTRRVAHAFPRRPGRGESLTRAHDVARRALEATSGEAEAVAQAETSGLARFAASEVHQPTLIDNLVVTLRVVRDGRVGVASTNRVDDEGLNELARRAEEAADSAPVDPDFPGLAGRADLPNVEGYDRATSELGPDDQARLAADAIGATEVPAYGFFTSAASELAIVSSTGLEAEQEMTDATVMVVAADSGCSGYAEATSWRAGSIDPAAVAREASEKAAQTSGASEIAPGPYPAVLEPYAFADLLQYFSYDSFGALGLLEERGFFAGRLGERVFDERVSIADDALDSRGLPKAFDFEGSPKRRVELVTDGVARGVVWDRTTARRARNGAATT